MKITFITTKMLRILCCSVILLDASSKLLSAEDILIHGQQVQEQSLAGATLKQSIRERGKPTQRKKTIASNLCLHQLLLTIQSNIKRILGEQLDPKNESGLEQKQDLLLAAQIAGDAVRLLEQIIFELNEQCFMYNPEIEYRFIRMCTTLKEVDFQIIEPHHLRTQYESTKDFDLYLKLYCLHRKDFLNIEDKKLFDKITKFNQMLMLRDHNGSNVLLNEDYFDISYFDTFTDYVVYRPWEFACEHPYFTAAVVGSIAAVVGYFYVYPWWIRYDNQNQEYDVLQEHGLKQGRADCGYYSLLHALVRRNAQNDEEFKQMLARAYAQNDLMQPWKAEVERQREAYIAEQQRAGRSAEDIADMERGFNWATREEIEAVLRNRNLVNQVMQPIVGANKNIVRDNVVVLDRVVARDPAAQRAELIRQHREMQRIRRTAGLRPERLRTPDNFDDFAIDGDNDFINELRRNNIEQHVVLYLNNHWIEVSIKPDRESKHGIHARIINSARGNVTNNADVNRLLQACAIN